MRRLSLLASVLLCLCLLAPAASAQRFLGSISLVGFNFAPEGAHFCDGSLLPISQYDALFNLIGTTYGGDGQNTFALPDLRGRMAVGMGQAPGLSPYIIGQAGGTEMVTLNVNQIPSHTHQAVASTSPGNTVSPTSAYWAPGPRILLYSAPANLAAMNPAAVMPAGGTQPHDNIKPYLAMNYVIWLQGIYPTPN